MYLQKESVELAVRLFDQTELELGSGQGLIKVQEAKWEDKSKEGGDAEGGQRKKKKMEEPGTGDKKKVEEKARKMGKKAAALRQ